jgi:hypothetical protein
MKIPDNIRKAVAYIAFENKTNGNVVPVGSCFFLGHDPKPGEATSPKVYLVTAKHVIDQLKKRGVKDLIVRLNPKDPNGDVITERIPLNGWYVHPTDQSIDVAIFEKGIGPEVDHLVLPLSLCVTEALMKNHEVGLGDEVFISGLFSHHFGTKRNIPIVRTGNLAALNDEKIEVDGFGEIDGFLVEARSTGGLSGSPAFLNLGLIRVVGGELKTNRTGDAVLLLGLVHGHFIVRARKRRTTRKDELNAGIAIIVSVASIRAVVDAYEAGASMAATL